MESTMNSTIEFHRKVNSVLQPAPSVLSKSESPYQNLEELNLFTDHVERNGHLYLPPTINADKITGIEKIELSTIINHNIPCYAYKVDWFQASPTNAAESSKNYEKTVQEKPATTHLPNTSPYDELPNIVKHDPKISGSDDTLYTNGVCRAEEQNSGDRVVYYDPLRVKSLLSEGTRHDVGLPLFRKASSMTMIPGKVRCDGPCARIIDSWDTVQFGCDHAICGECRRTANSTALFDGSPGCCNESCVAQARVNGDKVWAGQSPSMVSVISQLGAVEAVATHISILKNYGPDVLRTQLEFEFPSTARLSVIIKCLHYYKDLIANSRFYYSSVKPMSRMDLLPISLTDTNLRFYDIVDLRAPPILYILIVGKEIQFYDSK